MAVPAVQQAAAVIIERVAAAEQIAYLLQHSLAVGQTVHRAAAAVIHLAAADHRLGNGLLRQLCHRFCCIVIDAQTLGSHVGEIQCRLRGAQRRRVLGRTVQHQRVYAVLQPPDLVAAMQHPAAVIERVAGHEKPAAAQRLGDWFRCAGRGVKAPDLPVCAVANQQLPVLPEHPLWRLQPVRESNLPQRGAGACVADAQPICTGNPHLAAMERQLAALVQQTGKVVQCGF